MVCSQKEHGPEKACVGKSGAPVFHIWSLVYFSNKNSEDGSASSEQGQ